MLGFLRYNALKKSMLHNGIYVKENKNMLQPYTIQPLDGLRALINADYRANEYDVVAKLMDYAELTPESNEKIMHHAKILIQQVRMMRKNAVGVDSFLNTYSLSTQEGIALMCLAEALLRVPDQATIDKLIRDKLTTPNWQEHIGKSDSFFINATTWALVLTGKALKPSDSHQDWTRALKGFFNRSSETVVRTVIAQAMKVLSRQFVMGKNIAEAIKRGEKYEAQGYRFSYDMLGEAALTQKDAQKYYEAYVNAIKTLGESVDNSKSIVEKSNISVKLSALHPRYSEAHAVKVRKELGQCLLELAILAKEYQVGLTVDAEESERLALSLDIFSDVYLNPKLSGWHGFGLAVQSYQKRAFTLIDWVADLARQGGRRIMVRLIKGAYWDSEIKRTQINGLKEYPVFTRKIFTDVSFQACAKKLLTYTDEIYPQFATHNAHSVSTILELAGSYRDFEFQCLHGMGKELYEQIVPANKLNIPCRVYAPVGCHEDLLPYLVRRLLENGANSSFVNRIVDENVSIDELVENPIEISKRYMNVMNQNIPLPWAIFLPQRENSRGIDWSDREQLAQLQKEFETFQNQKWFAGPMLSGNDDTHHTKTTDVLSPQNQKDKVGEVCYAQTSLVNAAFENALQGFKKWSKINVDKRAHILEKFARLLEENRLEAITLACREAGKTLEDGIAEVREAIDFCRYYAYQARQMMEYCLDLPGYTGELNQWSLHPRGVMVCISPWNFPLAIFVGQVVAALVTGNCVIAKPAEQTSLIAAYAVKLMRIAGFPNDVIQLLPGHGEDIGAALVKHPQTAGVIFTGSSEVASLIAKSLADKKGPIVPLIAETGGLNAMIVDSSALLEQVIRDVLSSAFGSAGQRCSALRVVYVQQDVYPRFKALLQGAMAELNIGLPSLLTTDVGPVIDETALKVLKTHATKMKKQHEVIFEYSLNVDTHQGHFMAPIAFKIPSIDVLKKEVFGPLLHVITFDGLKLAEVVDEINQTGYGLTLGIQSRINETIAYIREHAHVGNCYVNRNMIGAVVGLQPFGGEGLSGTGPKAGGPLYLQRLCHERTYTVDTTAAGGNASLMSLTD